MRVRLQAYALVGALCAPTMLYADTAEKAKELQEEMKQLEATLKENTPELGDKKLPSEIQKEEELFKQAHPTKEIEAVGAKKDPVGPTRDRSDPSNYRPYSKGSDSPGNDVFRREIRDGF